MNPDDSTEKLKSRELYGRLTQLPLRERPRMLSPPWERSFFQGHRLTLLLAVFIGLVVNGGAAMLHLRSWVPLLSPVIASGLLPALHGALCSGIFSTNTGTVCRDTEPVRFWLGMLFLSVCILIAAAAAWLI